MCFNVRLMNPNADRVFINNSKCIGYLEEYSENFVRTISSEKPETKLVENDIKLDHLPVDEKSILLKVLRKHCSVFSLSKRDIGCTKALKHCIDTGDSGPIAIPMRNVPLALQDKVDSMVDEMLQDGVVEPSASAWNSPIVLVRKKSGDLRMCIDFRQLNSVTKKSSFPIPSTNSLLDALEGSSYFSTLDLTQGYYQVELNDVDREKTAFMTRRGQFQFKRMPFGLNTAPITFQKVMHIVLRNENWLKCLIYLDDIIIFGSSLTQHMERLDTVLTKIKEAGLKLSTRKCVFLKKEVTFLGHVVSQKGIHTDNSKVKVIQEWPVPKDTCDLRKFIGFCGYYRRFVNHYANIVRPLEQLLNKLNSYGNKRTKKMNINSSWELTHQQAFDTLKNRLCTAPILAYPQSSGRFILDTDASAYGIGAVLSQVQNGDEKVIAYASHSLSKTEQRYCVTRRELLSVYRYVKQFKHYLFGRHFTIRTDHKSLVWLLNCRNPSTSQYCSWKAELEIFDFEIIHRSGDKHTNADILSRLAECGQCGIKHTNPLPKRNVKIFNANSSVISNARDIVLACREDHLTIREYINANVSSKVEKNHLMSIMNELILMNNRLFFKDTRGLREIPILSRRTCIIRDFHNMLCHLSAEKVYSVLVKKFYWKGMFRETKNVIDECDTCLKMKNAKPLHKSNIEVSEQFFPFERIAMDISGPFRLTKSGNQYILAISDYFSKLTCFIPLKNTLSQNICDKFLEHWVAKYGIPLKIHTDQGQNFNSALFKQMCDKLGIQKTRTCPYYPQSDGLVERSFRTVKPLIASVMEDKGCEWDKTLPLINLALLSATSKQTGYSPYQVLYGKNVKHPMCTETEYIRETSENYVNDLTVEIRQIYKKVKETQDNQRASLKLRVNKNRYFKKPSVGDYVYVEIPKALRKSFEPKFQGPYEIKTLITPTLYELICTKTDKLIIRNYNQIKVKLANKVSEGDNNVLNNESNRRNKNHIEKAPKKHPDETKEDNQKRYPRRRTKPVDRFFNIRGGGSVGI